MSTIKFLLNPLSPYSLTHFLNISNQCEHTRADYEQHRLQIYFCPGIIIKEMALSRIRVMMKTWNNEVFQIKNGEHAPGGTQPTNNVCPPIPSLLTSVLDVVY